ncbi:MAG: hypothetical protein Q4D62_06265 [Planctomycetia bacterium]|nr:hypothetical protein [Planctomycetia bacterium]
MDKRIYRVVTQGVDGNILTEDFDSIEDVKRRYRQKGTDDCTMIKHLKKLPVFEGLIGPLPEGPFIRYESKAVFELLTPKWHTVIPVKRKRKSS